MRIDRLITNFMIKPNTTRTIRKAALARPKVWDICFFPPSPSFLGLLPKIGITFFSCQNIKKNTNLGLSFGDSCTDYIHVSDFIWLFVKKN